MLGSKQPDCSGTFPMLSAEKCRFVGCGQIVNLLKPRKGKYTGCDRHLGAAVDS